jgi:hypothetical protein
MKERGIHSIAKLALDAVKIGETSIDEVMPLLLNDDLTKLV